MSRIPEQRLDTDVQDETVFENKVFALLHVEERKNMIKRRGQDSVIRKAIKRLRRGRQVESGQLKKVASHLNLQNGMLFFDARVVVPKAMQSEILRDVHAAGHFGQARTIKTLRRS